MSNSEKVEMIAGLPDDIVISTSRFDEVKGRQFAAEANLTAAIDNLAEQPGEQTLSITLPADANIFLLPSIGYLNTNSGKQVSGLDGVLEYRSKDAPYNVIYIKTTNADGTVTIAIKENVVAKLHQEALADLNSIKSAIPVLNVIQNLFQSLKNGIGNNINDVKNAIKLAEQVLANNAKIAATSMLQNSYNLAKTELTEFREIFELPNDSLQSRVKAKLDSCISEIIVSKHELLASKHALEVSVMNKKMVLYTTNDSDIPVKVSVDGDSPYNRDIVIPIDAAVNGIKFGDDGQPVAEVVMDINHILGPNPNFDTIELNLTINVNFADSGSSANHIISVILPPTLAELSLDPCNLLSSWKFDTASNSLFRESIADVKNLTETLTLEVKRADFIAVVNVAELSFKVKFISSKNPPLPQ